MALQEAKDCLLGRLFAYGALVRSGRLVEEWISDKNTPYIKEFTSLIISLAAKKRYLQEPAVSVILDLVEKVIQPIHYCSKGKIDSMFKSFCIFILYMLQKLGEIPASFLTTRRLQLFSIDFIVLFLLEWVIQNLSRART